MLQESVDAYLTTVAVVVQSLVGGSWKSLLRPQGKQGRFRQNLVRVDYSGRSVIVAGTHT